MAKKTKKTSKKSFDKAVFNDALKEIARIGYRIDTVDENTVFVPAKNLYLTMDEKFENKEASVVVATEEKTFKEELKKFFHRLG